MNIAKIMKQAQQMQANAEKVQKELAARSYEASSGGGLVTAVTTGDGQLKSLTVSPALLKDGDVEMLQDLVVAAVRESLTLGKNDAQKEMGKLTAGLGIPGLG